MLENDIKIYLKKLDNLKQEIHKVIIGQEETIDQILLTMLAGGHAILEGVPGLAKTLMVQTIANAVNLSFKRIQFTPDLMPGDILGTEILEEDHASGKRFFKFYKGPVFANIVLADEINRTAPKTQSALLEVMQEHKVSYAGKDYILDEPFFILATQNPIEQAGTFPLPEAQLDRFLLYIRLDYPKREDEFNILKSTTGKIDYTLKGQIDREDFIKLQSFVRDVTIDDELIHFVNKMIRLSRPNETESPEIKEWLKWGAGPRAGQAIILTAKANALLRGRFAVIPDDIKRVSYPVLRHRLILNYKSELENISCDDVCTHLLEITGK